jgi:hypothetical protein
MRPHATPAHRLLGEAILTVVAAAGAGIGIASARRPDVPTRVVLAGARRSGAPTDVRTRAVPWAPTPHPSPGAA